MKKELNKLEWIRQVKLKNKDRIVKTKEERQIIHNKKLKNIYWERKKENNKQIWWLRPDDVYYKNRNRDLGDETQFKVNVRGF